MINKLVFEDSLNFLQKKGEKYNLIYIDPPFNLGHAQKRKRYKNGCIDEELSQLNYNDKFDDFENFIIDRVKLAFEYLHENASLFIHLDQKEIHYIKVALDKLLGRHRFMNEIIYCWDYGGKSKNKWSVKHNNILWYTVNPKNYIFNYDEIDRIPYLAPELVRNTCKSPEIAEEKIRKGKIPTSVWNIGIVPTVSKENVKYPTQKPLKLLDRIINVHTNVNDKVLDFFAGSGSTAISAAKNNRYFTVVDKNKQAIEIMKKRFDSYDIRYEFIESIK